MYTVHVAYLPYTFSWRPQQLNHYRTQHTIEVWTQNVHVHVHVCMLSLITVTHVKSNHGIHCTHGTVHCFQTSKERDELLGRVSTQREAIHSLQTEMETSSQALTAAGTDASRLRSKVTQLQGLLDAGTWTHVYGPCIKCPVTIEVSWLESCPE